MKKTKQKNLSVMAVVEEVNALKKEISEKQKRLDELTSLQFKPSNPEPQGFEYKTAIMQFFEQDSGVQATIDDIVSFISAKYNFHPNRSTVGLRITYLVDNAKKLERVSGGRKGVYQLKKSETPVSTNTGVSG